MTGFITGNIIRTEKLKQAANLPSWDLYAKNAFVQSCSLLEVCCNDNAAFLDYPLIDVQSRDVTEDTISRWGQFKVGLRYHYVDEALMDMRTRGIINTLQPKFFRYLSYHLWDRFLTQIIDSYNSTEDFKLTPYLEDLIKRSLNLASFLDKREQERYRDEILSVKRGLAEHSAALQHAIKKAGDLGKLMDFHSGERYPFQFLKK